MNNDLFSMDLKGKIITQRPRKMKLEEEAHMYN